MSVSFSLVYKHSVTSAAKRFTLNTASILSSYVVSNFVENVLHIVVHRCLTVYRPLILQCKFTAWPTLVRPEDYRLQVAIKVNFLNDVLHCLKCTLWIICGCHVWLFFVFNFILLGRLSCLLANIDFLRRSNWKGYHNYTSLWITNVEGFVLLDQQTLVWAKAWLDPNRKITKVTDVYQLTTVRQWICMLIGMYTYRTVCCRSFLIDLSAARETRVVGA